MYEDVVVLTWTHVKETLLSNSC